MATRPPSRPEATLAVAVAAGHSGTPLAKKLALAAGRRIAVLGPPDSDRASLDPLPAAVVFVGEADADCGLVHLFTADRAALAEALRRCRGLLGPDAVVWVS